MIILDFTSPLIPDVVDPKGNAQHWFIRTAEAAIDKTFFGWLGTLSDPEAWDRVCATPANSGFAPSVNPRFTSRAGLQAETIQRKHLGAYRAAFAKAVRAWEYAFREEGDKFFDVLQQKTSNYQDATKDYLGYMGLRIRDWLGSIALHIMLFCGNPDAWNFLKNRVDIVVLHFPEHPIIPVTLRTFFNQDCMSVLARDLFLTLPQPDLDAINGLLAGIVGAYISGEYAPPPRTYLRLEHVSGFFQMHSHAESLFDVQPPTALDLRAPLLQPVAPPGEVVLVPDLFAYVTPGDLDVADCSLAMAAYEASVEDTLIFLHRSDTMSLDVQINAPVPNVVMIPTPPLGTTWQIVLRTGSTPTERLSGSLSGTFWFHDTAGQQSNHATWRIEGTTPVALSFVAGVDVIAASIVPYVVIPDLGRYLIPGDFPLQTVLIALTSQLGNIDNIALALTRSDDGMTPIDLGLHAGQVFAVPMPPGGVRLRLLVYAPGITSLHFPVLFLGTVWVIDTEGNESNHASWGIALTSSH